MTNENESTIFIWLGFRKGIYMVIKKYRHHMDAVSIILGGPIVRVIPS